MASFGERFKQLRAEKNLTQTELAEKFYTKNSSISRYENDIQIPEIDTLRKFADFFNVSIDYLLGRTNIRDYMILGKKSWAGKYIDIPVISVIREDEPIYKTDNIVDYRSVPGNNLSKGDYFYLEVPDDSMERCRIMKGDSVLVKVQDEVDNGDMVVAIPNGKNTVIRKFYKSDRIVTLLADSFKSGYQPLIIDTRKMSVRIIGKVVQAVIHF